MVIKEKDEIRPNCFGTNLNTEGDDIEINMIFGNMSEKADQIDVLSSIILHDTAFKSVLKHMIDVADKLGQATGKDILEEILDEFEKEGMKDETIK